MRNTTSIELTLLKASLVTFLVTVATIMAAAATSHAIPGDSRPISQDETSWPWDPVGWRPGGSGLSYIRRVNEVSTIMYMDLREGTTRPLTPRGDDQILFTSWSPDGSKLAYYQYSSPEPSGLYSVEPPGKRIRLLAEAEVTFSPRWAPDSRRLAVYLRRPGGLWVFGIYDLTVIDTSERGLPERLILGVQTPTPDMGVIFRAVPTLGVPGWSADGSVVYYEGRVEYQVDWRLGDGGIRFGRGWPAQGSRYIFGQPSDGGNRADRLTSGNVNMQNEAIAVSHNGRMIAYTKIMNGSMDIYVVDVNSGVERRVTSNQGYDRRPVWSPDDRKIAYEASAGADYDANDFEIYTADLSRNGNGVPPRVNLTSNPANDISASWSPDGSKIAFYSNRGLANNMNYKPYMMDIPR